MVQKPIEQLPHCRPTQLECHRPPFVTCRCRCGRRAARAVPLLGQPALRARALPGGLDAVGGGPQGRAAGAALRHLPRAVPRVRPQYGPAQGGRLAAAWRRAGNECRPSSEGHATACCARGVGACSSCGPALSAACVVLPTTLCTHRCLQPAAQLAPARVPRPGRAAPGRRAARLPGWGRGLVLRRRWHAVQRRLCAARRLAAVRARPCCAWLACLALRYARGSWRPVPSAHALSCRSQGATSFGTTQLLSRALARMP